MGLDAGLPKSFWYHLVAESRSLTATLASAFVIGMKALVLLRQPGYAREPEMHQKPSTVSRRHSGCFVGAAGGRVNRDDDVACFEFIDVLAQDRLFRVPEGEPFDSLQQLHSVIPPDRSDLFESGLLQVYDHLVELGLCVNDSKDLPVGSGQRLALIANRLNRHGPL